MVDRLRNSEANARRIANVEACFGSSGKQLQREGRVLVGEGVLTKMCRKKPKPRQFFLFNDILVYGSIIISKKRYNKQHIIPLEEVMLENVEDEEEGDFENCWLVKTKRKSFVVNAATPTEKNEWMLHIQRCVQDLLKNGKVAATDHAAVWIPDQEANKCMCCKSTHFSVVNRRHHCRACGIVVCNGCSSKSFVLEGISKKPVRVCDTCYNKLCQGMSTSRPPSTVFISSPHSLGSPYAADSSDYSDEEDTSAGDSTYHEAPTFYSGQSPNNNAAPEKLI